ncbi:MAG: hypothetical protein AABX17_01560 [Nanoarchaeota archaeon]
MTNETQPKGLLKRIFEKPIRKLAIASLATLIGITTLKDNVHLGSTTLYNPQGNQYAWGIAPTLEIIGEAKGNLYSIGLVAGINLYGTNAVHNGDSRAIGLLTGINDYKTTGSHTGNSTVRGIYTRDEEDRYFLSHSIIQSPSLKQTRKESKLQVEKQ